jgi:hypothetical protein
MGADETTPNPPVRRWLIEPSRVGGSKEALDAVRWNAGEAFDTAVPTEGMIDLAREALADHQMTVQGDITLLRHRPGQRGLPPADDGSTHGFTIDLTDSRTSVEGGALLFLDDRGQGRGWKAQMGAMTVWCGSDPLLTELTPAAPERITLRGSALPVARQP